MHAHIRLFLDQMYKSSKCPFHSIRSQSIRITKKYTYVFLYIHVKLGADVFEIGTIYHLHNFFYTYICTRMS